ncbi:MAG: PD40 domain-containing protein [Anaerolineales bacterium]|uniref:PD40 domain-containing protein n=1 Tax=Candidatus Desulfolinea nitratireducens TaxID=2841698 RepID=A0A8J6NM50_9CHLR|nr:PD40 domain-containing protein [Candidatus Desulfolinea nitratireducens]MBL6961539.1 PD40 domain-containing protein [Anaerolineales bacterium]
MKKLIKPFLFAAFILSLLMPQTAQAHPADMYFHTIAVNLSAKDMQILWSFMPGPIVTHVIWQEADGNGDDSISVEEAESWIAPLLKGFSVKLDDISLSFELASVSWPDELDLLRAGEEQILIELHTDWPAGIDHSGGQELILLNEFNSQNSLNWYTINTEEGISFAAPEQDNGFLKVTFGENINDGESFWESGQPSIPPVVEALGLGAAAEEAARQAENQQGFLAILEGFLRTPDISPLLFMAAYVIALLLGALHALSPGHGKTIVAAYLVGSQGKAYHAIVLGLLVTLVHTGSVFALGLATLSLSQYFMPAQIFPTLELISGVLILVLGIALLVPRLRDFYIERKSRNQNPSPKRIEKSENRVRLVLDENISEPGPAHSHDPSQFGAIPVPRGVAAVAANPLSGISWRSLIALGISGGLVPCPDAIAILLIAVTINRIAFGLGLIVSFSLGLAVVLILIGIVMVRGKEIFSRLQWFSRVSYIVPVISALVVLGLGAALSVSAINKFPPGILYLGSSSDFDLEKAEVIYLAIDEAYHKQLFLIPASGGEARQITDGKNGVWSYSVSPDGRSLIYSTPDGKKGSELWFWNADISEPEHILSCAEESCSDILWSPNQEQILYSRLEFGDEQAYLGIPSMWWLDLNTKEPQPVFQDAQMPAYNPRWSFDGNWLSYTSANPLEIQIYNLDTGERQTLPTEIGSAAAWSPNAMHFLQADLQFVGDIYLSKISLFDLQDRSLQALPSEEYFDDTNPTWSKDGEWISFSRGEWTLSRPPSGDQLWVSRPDGSEARPLTSDTETTHGPVAWSADGRYLLYRAYAVASTQAPSQIRIFDLETNEVIQVAAPGENPSWFISKR